MEFIQAMKTTSRTANVLRLSDDRWQKLASDNNSEARYHAEHAAISKALAQQGKQMLRRQSRPIYEIRGTRTEIHYLEGGWWSADREIQVLINRAIAGVKQ